MVFLQKRFSVYACLLHGFIICLFVFWGTADNKKEKEDKVHISRIVEIDVFTPAKNAVMAESITNEDLIAKILSSEDISRTFSQKEKIERAEEQEKKRFNQAKIYQAKKEAKRKIERDKEKARIKAENKKIQEKLEKDQQKLKEKKDKEKKKLDKIEKNKAEKRNRDRKLKEANRIKQIKKQSINKPVKNNDRKTLSKRYWLDTPSGKADYDVYSSALYNKVYSRWIKPFHAKTGWNCSLEIHQDRNGRVKNIKGLSCNPNNKELRNSVQKAVMQASPLPLPKDPRLFDKTVIFKFSVE